MKKWKSVAAALMLTVSMGMGVSAETTESLNVAITKDENTLSPFTYVSGTGLTVNRLIFDTLLTTDAEDQIIPWMVEDDYETVDFKEFTFTLKDGQKFHNGDPLTAEDVKFSFEYPSTQNVSGQRKVCDKLEKVEVLDEKTIKFTLKEPDINYLRDGFCYIRILDKAVYDGVEDASSVMDTVGSGMYRLAEYKTGEYYKLEAVEDYFRGAPAVKKLNMPIMGDSTAVSQALLSGELAASTGSIGTEMLDLFEQTEEIQVYSNPGFAPLIVNINNERAPFDQVEFRQALAYGIDVNTICDTLYSGHALVGTKGAVRSDLSYAQSGLEYVYDKEKAEELLDDLGYTQKNEEGIRLDEIPDGVALEQGNGHVHQGAQAVEHQHPYKVPAEGPHKGGQPFPDAPVKGFCIFFFFQPHACFPPSRIRMSLFIWIS